jgi:hypothetical protein
MNSLRQLILITLSYYAPVVMDMFTYVFRILSVSLSCNYTKVKNKYTGQST